jgi:hypothetical protein
MTVGMVPMALALERGSQMQAPLGRAVIGGLVMSTFATLLVLPSIFALVVGRRKAKSPSIYPDDPESRHYDPRVFLNEEYPAQDGHAPEDGSAGHNGHANGHPVVDPAHPEAEEVVVFLKRILDEARSHRSDMTTHYTTDDLLVALGFAKSKTEDPNAPGVKDLAAAVAIAKGSQPAQDGGHASGPEAHRSPGDHR